MGKEGGRKGRREDYDVNECWAIGKGGEGVDIKVSELGGKGMKKGGKGRKGSSSEGRRGGIKERTKIKKRKEKREEEPDDQEGKLRRGGRREESQGKQEGRREEEGKKKGRQKGEGGLHEHHQPLALFSHFLLVIGAASDDADRTLIFPRVATEVRGRTLRLLRAGRLKGLNGKSLALPRFEVDPIYLPWAIRYLSD